MSAALQTSTAPVPVAPTTSDATRLVELEAEVERGFDMAVRGFEIAGRALQQIRDAKLYLATHPNWESYCRERWDISRSYAHRKMKAAAIAALLPIGNRPENEAQARALLKVVDPRDHEAAVAVWEEVERLVDEQGKDGPTAALVREAGKLRRRQLAAGEKAFFLQFSAFGTRGSTWADLKPPPVNLRRAIEVSERHREWVNREYRIPKGLPPHPKSNTVKGWEAELAKGAERVRCPTCGHRVKPEDISP